MILFGLLFDALITPGRLFIGYFAASQCRYTTNDVLVLAGIYMTVLSGAPSRGLAKPGAKTPRTGWKLRLAITWIWGYVERIDQLPVRRLVLAAIATQVAFSLHFAFADVRGLHQGELTAASVTRNINHEAPGEVVTDLYFIRSKWWLLDQTQFLREHHVSLFG